MEYESNVRYTTGHEDIVAGEHVRIHYISNNGSNSFVYTDRGVVPLDVFQLFFKPVES